MIELDEMTDEGVAVGDDLAARELLAVSFHYPPAASPRAVQVARLLKHLKVKTTLVCADYDDAKDRVDPTLVRGAEAPLAHCLRVPFKRSAPRRLLTRVAYRLDLPLVDRSPDRFTSWRPGVLSAVERFLNGGGRRPDVLVTFGSPMSDHLIGLALKRRLGVPWVAHFSDPWLDNPFVPYDRLSRRVNRSLQNPVLGEADRLVFTSEETVELVASRQGRAVAEKSRVLGHAFEPALFDETATRDESRLVVRHLGALYGPRSPAPLFEALRRLSASDPAALAGVRFELVGTQGEGQLAAAGLGALPEGLVVSRPSVEYLESLRLMRESDGLLVIDAPAELSVFLPSKLIDYVGAARPVCAITPEGTAARVVRRLGGWVADPSDAAAIAETLKSFIAFLRGHKHAAAWGDAEARRGFEAPAVAEKFAGVLREVLG
ncbi:MAG TPA: glycosyltransferase [Pyrinomonadaceae bacterium]|nr:glycosyltransferase [Pyrinomonadaceae bacterium]